MIYMCLAAGVVYSLPYLLQPSNGHNETASPPKRQANGFGNGDHATTAAQQNGDDAPANGDGAGAGAADTGILRPDDIDTRFYQLPGLSLLAPAWAGLLRDEKTTEANELEALGRRLYEDAAFQAEMDEAVNNG